VQELWAELLDLGFAHVHLVWCIVR
jgi:hypothetical protein